jgi:ribose/xylose/arabinose/galactoside ABC-type transport system permease subunit
MTRPSFRRPARARSTPGGFAQLAGIVAVTVAVVRRLVAACVLGTSYSILLAVAAPSQPNYVLTGVILMVAVVVQNPQSRQGARRRIDGVWPAGAGRCAR